LFFQLLPPKKPQVRIYSDFLKQNVGNAFELLYTAHKHPKWDFVLAFSTPKTLRIKRKSFGKLTIIPDIDIKDTSIPSPVLFNNPIPAMLQMKTETFFWHSKDYIHEIPDLLFDFSN
jgi:hypothetical protein